jgi:hypothetical protein
VVTAIVIVWVMALFVCGILAYFTVAKGASGSVDGLGRPLSEAPMLMRIFFGQDRMWAGWFWFATDLVIFWGSLAAISAIFGRRAK